MAHGLNTSYQSFVEKNKKEPIIIKFHKLIQELDSEIPFFDDERKVDDNNIILGFARGDIPHLCTNEYINYSKGVLKEKLNFLRFLKRNNYENIEELVKEFTPHLVCMFSGKGGYDFPINDGVNKESYDTGSIAKPILEYGEENGFFPAVDKTNYSNGKLLKQMSKVKDIELIYY